jgi:hypothetical protein
VFTPLIVIERLAALTPRPRINRLVYHGLLAERPLAAGGGKRGAGKRCRRRSTITDVSAHRVGNPHATSVRA